MATIDTICSDIENIIKASTPTYLPGLRYKTIPRTQDIEIISDVAEETTRSFQVRPGQVTGYGHYSCTTYSLIQDVSVYLRYMTDDRVAMGKAAIDLMWASDVPNIIRALTNPPLTVMWTVTGLYHFRFSSAEELASAEFADTSNYIYLCRIVFSANYAP